MKQNGKGPLFELNYDVSQEKKNDNTHISIQICASRSVPWSTSINETLQ